MYRLFFAAWDKRFSGANFRLVPLAPCSSPRRTDWDEIGRRVAFAGGIYPLILAGAMLVASGTCLLWVDGPAFAPWAHRLLLQILATLAAGFPFVLFSCFLLSTMVAVPLISIVAWVANRVNVQLSSMWLTVLGIGLVATAWTLVFCFVVCW